MEMTLRGIILVLAGFPVVINLGISRWLIPAFQITVGRWTILWIGSDPLHPMTGVVMPVQMPIFLMGFTKALLHFDAGQAEGDLVAHGPFIDVEDRDE